jgi:hypothetical protein
VPCDVIQLHGESGTQLTVVIIDHISDHHNRLAIDMQTGRRYVDHEINARSHFRINYQTGIRQLPREVAFRSIMATI